MGVMPGTLSDSSGLSGGTVSAGLGMDVSAAGSAEARLVVRERPSVPATTAPTATPALPMRKRRRSQSGMPDTVFAFRRGRSSSPSRRSRSASRRAFRDVPATGTGVGGTMRPRR